MRLPLLATLSWVALALASAPASAQLGAVANPPRHDLYHFAPEKRLDTGLGANAETHQPSATAARAAHRTVRRRVAP